ncbi:hypothetical protein FHX78_115874 [Streptomyces capillispiralis]|uniref:Uncharacterized protein n=1 Tax=Streptomyces capillispiralis TaxID=68182 RepID=A0A561TNX7_9ACTN|nr:hypothetical protein FHX78_115874 [Streptomyces capillispiralis]
MSIPPTGARGSTAADRGTPVAATRPDVTQSKEPRP